MTWGRGFFRAWVFLAAVWLAGSVAFFGPKVEDAWQNVVPDVPAGFVPDIPVDCNLTRGSVSTAQESGDYEPHDGKCWYDLARFRRLYPE